MSACACIPEDPAPWAPACMDADELVTWAESNDHITSRQERATRPCEDCPLGFAAEMRDLDRCNGTPGGVKEDEDMVTTEEGTALDLTLKKEAPRPAIELRTRVALDVSAPACASCLHEPVCALRRALEGIGTVETTAPPLPDGLHLALVATIACDHYARDRAKPAPARVLTSQERGQAAKRQVSEETRERMRQAQIRVIAERRAAAGAKPA